MLPSILSQVACPCTLVQPTCALSTLGCGSVAVARKALVSRSHVPTPACGLLDKLPLMRLMPYLTRPVLS